MTHEMFIREIATPRTPAAALRGMAAAAREKADKQGARLVELERAIAEARAEQQRCEAEAASFTETADALEQGGGAAADEPQRMRPLQLNDPPPEGAFEEGEIVPLVRQRDKSTWPEAGRTLVATRKEMDEAVHYFRRMAEEYARDPAESDRHRWYTLAAYALEGRMVHHGRGT